MTTYAAPARRLAYEVIHAVSTSDAYANLALPVAIRRQALSPQDAGFATELTYGTLRRLGTYDAVIEMASKRDIDTVEPAVRDALRLGIHQVLATRVADHAAVNETVQLVRDMVGNRATGFANAVMRRVVEADLQTWLARLEEAARSDDERLSVIASHPVWVIRAFRRALAAEGRVDELEALLAADNASPSVVMAALPGLAEIPPDATRTAGSPVGFQSPGGDPAATVRESEGRIRVQDEGSQLVALALTRSSEIKPGEKWLDLCAGPGGKTAILAAEALAGGATLEANEVTPARAGLVRQAIAGIPLDVVVHEEDGRDFAAMRPNTYDRILVDAPCTGLGALRRRPESRWRKQPSDVAELADLQFQLLDAALMALKPGGTLAYVTCSPHLGETTGVLTHLNRAVGDEYTELDARAAVQTVSRTPLDLPAPLDGSGRAQLWPHRHGTDGMFLSLLQKKA